ncbi:antitoxin [Clostridia bacterium]|nr:antitoxin [Clostridia bacterium]GHU74251.1 antitoxin [Clostridia bacterium]
MKSEYDFSKGVKNPYYKELHKNVTIPVDLYLYERFEQISKEKGVSVERIINHCLNQYAEKLRTGGAFCDI